MLRELCKIFKVIGGGKNFIFLLLLRCPFDAIRSILQALFLQQSFIAINEKNTSNLELKSLVFSLAEINKIMSGGITNDKLIASLSRKRMAWEDSISIAKNKMEAIDNISSRLSKSQTAMKLHELTDEQRAWLLVKMVCVEDLRGQTVLSEAIWL